LQKGEVLVDAAYAEQRGTRVGDTITDFRTKETFQIAGTVKDGGYSHAPVLWMTDESWQAWQSKMGTSFVSAYSGQSLQTDQALFLKQAVVENVPGYAAEQNSFQMMRVALVVIGALILTAFFYILTMQKMKQLGVLKAIGIRTRTTGASLLVQVVILTSLAFGVNVVITYLTGRFLPTDLPFRFKWSTSLMYGGILLVTAILGALVPLRMLKKIEAADPMGGMDG
jgi:putative ABC transport system permease protein